MNRTDRLAEEIEQLRSEAQTICDANPQILEGDELERFEALEHQIKTLRVKEKGLRSIETASRAGFTESGDGAALHVWRQSSDPWTERRNGHKSEADVRSLAFSAIEKVRGAQSDDDREHATRVMERLEGQPLAANHVLDTSDPTYEDAWRVYIANPTEYAARMTREQLDAFRTVNASPIARANERDARAAMSLTTGAPLVPLTLDPTIMLTSAGAIDPFREIARIETIATDDWNGVTSAGVTAEWLAENTEAADATPTVSSATITAHKAAAYLEASLEVSMDSNLPDQIGSLILDAKQTLESAAFQTGSGSGQPFGLITRLALTTASRVAGSSGAAGSADFVVGDVFALQNALPPRHRPRSSWMAEISHLNAIRRFANVTAGTAPASYWTDFGGETPPTLLGRPVYEGGSMESTSTVNSGSNDDVLVLGDFRNYIVVDRVGLSIGFNPFVIGSNRRPTGTNGWFAFWRVGGDVPVVNAFRSLRI